MQSQQSCLNNGAGDELADRADLEQPVAADLLGVLGDVGPLQVGDCELVELLLGVGGEAEGSDSGEDVEAEHLDDFDDVGEF